MKVSVLIILPFFFTGLLSAQTPMPDVSKRFVKNIVIVITENDGKTFTLKKAVTYKTETEMTLDNFFRIKDLNKIKTIYFTEGHKIENAELGLNCNGVDITLDLTDINNLKGDINSLTSRIRSSSCVVWLTFDVYDLSGNKQHLGFKFK